MDEKKNKLKNRGIEKTNETEFIVQHGFGVWR